MEKHNEFGNEFVELILNNAGEDFTVVVSQETANILLNDADEAKRYLREAGAVVPSTSTVDESSHENIPNIFDADNVLGSNNKYVWTSKKPNERDHDATVYFLELRKQYADKFDDRRTIKNQVWALIATKMNENGYYVGEKKEAIEKCRMKFANLQKTYLGYIKHINTTGEEKKDPPPYYIEMHEILGLKDKTDPKNLQDTMEQAKIDSNKTKEQITITDSITDDEVDNDSRTTLDINEYKPKKEDIENRFKKTNVKPQSNSEMVLEVIKKQHEENIQERREHFRQIQNMINLQNEQRDRFLDQFQTLINLQRERVRSKGRKRNRSSDEESN